MHQETTAASDTSLPPNGKRFNRFAASRDKALALFAAKGFAEVGMRELATSMGLTPGALYHHYPSKQHLLFDFVEEFYQELLAVFPGRGMRQRQPLEQVIATHLDLFDQWPSHFKVAVRDNAALTREHQAQVVDLRRQYYQRLGASLGFESELDSETCAALHAIAMLLGTAPTWLAEPGMPLATRRALIGDLLKGAIERLTPPRSSSKKTRG